MTIRDAFALGWIAGCVLSKHNIDFHQALKRFDKANEKKGIKKGYIDPVFGFVDCEDDVNAVNTR